MICGTTKVIGLLGSPVSHSKSPRMQNGVFEALGLDFVYVAFDVGPEGLKAAVEGLRAMNFRGGNVTMPHKRAVCQHLDRLTAAATLAGAVNVIVNDGGVLTGHISDGEGFMLSLDDAGVAYRGKKMTLLGAGGAASAVAIQAAMDGMRAVCMFNRQDGFFASAQHTMARLRAEFACEAQCFDLADTERLRREIASSDILVNGTPLGMHETAGQCALPDGSFLHPGLVVGDMIYVPEETALLKMARDAGLKTVSGLGMQLFQAVSAFRMWTGRDLPIELARAMLSGQPIPADAAR